MSETVNYRYEPWNKKAPVAILFPEMGQQEMVVCKAATQPCAAMPCFLPCAPCCLAFQSGTCKPPVCCIYHCKQPLNCCDGCLDKCPPTCCKNACNPKCCEKRFPKCSKVCNPDCCSKCASCSPDLCKDWQAKCLELKRPKCAKCCERIAKCAELNPCNPDCQKKLIARCTDPIIEWCKEKCKCCQKCPCAQLCCPKPEVDANGVPLPGVNMKFSIAQGAQCIVLHCTFLQCCCPMHMLCLQREKVSKREGDNKIITVYKNKKRKKRKPGDAADDKKKEGDSDSDEDEDDKKKDKDKAKPEDVKPETMEREEVMA